MKSLNKSLLSKDNFIVWLRNISLNDDDPSIRQIAAEILPLITEDFPVPPKPQYELLYSKYKFRLTSVKTEFGFRSSLSINQDGEKLQGIGIIESRPSVFIKPPLPSPSQTPTPDVTPSTTPSNTPSISITPSNSPTPSVTPSVTPTPSETPSETPSMGETPTPSESPTPYETPTPSETPTPTNTQSPASPQYLAPDGDVTVTSITGTPTNTVGNRYTNIDESTANNTDYVYGANNTAAVYECSLANPAVTPSVDTGHIVRFRYARVSGGTPSAAGPEQPVLTVGLYQNATLIASTSITLAITSAWIDASFTLTTTEASNITDYTDLRLRFSQTAVNNRGVGISWAALELPGY